jgi:iron complex outermembrane receptor protein
LAPNLQVTQLSASDYVVSARGFGGSPAAQNFSDKLLVLIDGAASIRRCTRASISTPRT